MKDRSKQNRENPRRKQGGYTVVELVMAMGIFALGVTGVAAMQTATSVSNRHAKNLAIATSIAKTWQEELAIDAMRWTDNPLSLTTDTTWLKTATPGSTPAWMVPLTNPLATMGASFDALGNFIPNAAAATFCVHIRLTPLMTAVGSGLTRTEVRVFWAKAGYAWEGGSAPCTAAPGSFRTLDTSATSSAGNTELDNFHFVYMTSAVRQNAGVF
jgi:Tfp pilus assembly protein PilV